MGELNLFKNYIVGGHRRILLLFLIIIFSGLLFPINVRGHNVSNPDNIVLSLSPESDFKQPKVGYFHITNRSQIINLTQISNSFIFDPILINLGIFNNTLDVNNESSGLHNLKMDIELLIIYHIFANGDYQEFSNQSIEIHENYNGNPEFYGIIDPSEQFPDLQSLIDNSTVIEYLRIDPTAHIKMDFQLIFTSTLLGILPSSGVNVRIETLFQRMQLPFLTLDDFHNKITGHLTSFPQGINMNHSSIFSNPDKIFVLIPLDFTARFLNNTLSTHNLSKIPKIKIRFVISIIDIEREIWKEDPLDLDLYYGSSKLKEKQKSNNSLEYNLDFIPSDNQILEFNFVNRGSPIQIAITSIIIEVPSLFHETSHDIYWLWRQLRTWWVPVLIIGSIMVRAHNVLTNEPEYEEDIVQKDRKKRKKTRNKREFKHSIGDNGGDRESVLQDPDYKKVDTRNDQNNNESPKNRLIDLKYVLSEKEIKELQEILENTKDTILNTDPTKSDRLDHKIPAPSANSIAKSIENSNPVTQLPPAGIYDQIKSSDLADSQTKSDSAIPIGPRSEHWELLWNEDPKNPNKLNPKASIDGHSPEVRVAGRTDLGRTDGALDFNSTGHSPYVLRSNVGNQDGLHEDGNMGIPIRRNLEKRINDDRNAPSIDDGNEYIPDKKDVTPPAPSRGVRRGSRGKPRNTGRFPNSGYNHVKPYSPTYQPNSYGSVQPARSSGARSTDRGQPKSGLKIKKDVPQEIKEIKLWKSKNAIPPGFFRRFLHKVSKLVQRQESNSYNSEEVPVKHTTNVENTDADLIEQVIEYLKEGKSLEWISRTLGIDIGDILSVFKEMNLLASELNFQYYDTLRNQKMEMLSEANEKLLRSILHEFYNFVHQNELDLSESIELIPLLGDKESVSSIERIVKLEEYSGEARVTELRLPNGAISSEYGLVRELMNLLDIHSQVLAKLCFYAHFNDVDSWVDKGVFQVVIDGKLKLLSVGDILGKNAHNPLIHELLQDWSYPNGIALNLHESLAGKNIFSIDPSIRFRLENSPREFYQNLKTSGDNYELSHIILTETGLAALLTSDLISHGLRIIKTKITKSISPTSPMLSRVATDRSGKRYGSVSVPKSTRKGSDKLFHYKHHRNFNQPINVLGVISMKHVGSKLNDFAYRMRIGKISSVNDLKSSNGPFIMEKVDTSRFGDTLKQDGSRILTPYRYHSLDGFGASSIDRIGRDLKNHFGIITDNTSHEPLWDTKTDLPSKMMLIAGHNNSVTHDSYMVGLDPKEDSLITTDENEQKTAVMKIKYHAFGPGEFDGQVDESLRGSEAFQAAKRIYDGFQIRFEEGILYESIYSKRSFAAHELDRKLSWEEIPNGNAALKKWNDKLRMEWAGARGLEVEDAPAVLLFDGIETQSGVRLNLNVESLFLKVFTGSSKELERRGSLLNNPVAEVEIRPDDFWEPDSEGRLGLRSTADVDLSYYKIEPEHFATWLDDAPSDIYGKRGDKSTIKRKDWYELKKEELVGPGGEWAVLQAARVTFDAAGGNPLVNRGEYRALVKARTEFINAAPTEGPIREMQRALLRLLVRNPQGGLVSHFSTAFSENGDELVFAPYTHVLEIMGYSRRQALNGLDRALHTIDLIQTFDEVVVSPLSSSHDGAEKDSEDEFRIDVTGKVLKAERVRELGMKKFADLLRLIEIMTAGSLRALLDPSYSINRSDIIKAGANVIEVMDSPDKYSRYSRSFNKEILNSITSLSSNDVRYLGSFVTDNIVRDRMFFGIDNFLKNVADSEKGVNINFSPKMYEHLRQFVTVKINENIVQGNDNSIDKIWSAVVKKGTEVKDTYIDENGNIYKFCWKDAIVKREPRKPNDVNKLSLKFLTTYFFKSNSNTIDFTNLRRTRDKGSVWVNSRNIGVVAFLIIDSLIKTFEKAGHVANETIRNLTETDPLNPNWIKRDVETGNWIPGEKFIQLFDDTDPVHPWSHMTKAISEAKIDISNKDSTGWLTKIYRFMASNNEKRPSPWIVRIFAGIPVESMVKKISIKKDEISEFRTTKQLTSVINEFMYAINTIENFVGPNIIEPSWRWRESRNLTSKPNLDRALINGGSWYSLLQSNQINFLKDIKNSLLSNNFLLLPSEYVKLLAKYQLQE